MTFYTYFTSEVTKSHGNTGKTAKICHACHARKGQGILLLFFLLKWADPGGTAIPGRPMTEAEQAPCTLSMSKNQFNIVVPLWGTYQILS